MKSFLKQIEESFQSLEEKKAKPDFLDLDNDGDTEESMKKAAKEKNEAAKPDYLDFDNDGDTEESMKKALSDKDEDELEEISTSAGAGAYMTPKAFGKADDDTVEALGYKRVQEAMDNKYERLIEGYKTFALSDPKMSPAKKVNASIKNVAKQLKEIEETIKYTSRLKTESGISHSGFGPSTSKALGKISERLIKISERVRSLGE
tara:strand:+ start:269 stop:883 length:615 start_codon:yes stop_codon:yes gene_type:complete